jgi:hypothetical protein
MSDFLSNLLGKVVVPESFKSNQSTNVYQTIAEKNGALLAVSVLLHIKPPVSKEPPVIGLALRFIERLNEEDAQEFTGFEHRQATQYSSSVHGKVNVLLLDKHWLPVYTFPASGKEIFEILNGGVLAQLRAWITTRVKACGGNITVTDDMFDQILTSKLEGLATDQEVLFKLPNLKPDGSIDVEPPAASISSLISSIPTPETLPKFAAQPLPVEDLPTPQEEADKQIKAAAQEEPTLPKEAGEQTPDTDEGNSDANPV